MTIKIKSAAYGTTKAGNDVTDIVQALVNNGNDDIPINNGTLGPDPDVGAKKQFGIVYTLANGTTLARAATEGDTLDLVT